MKTEFKYEICHTPDECRNSSGNQKLKYLYIIMSIQNKAIVRKLNQAFEVDDSGTILSLLTEDIRWDVLGALPPLANWNMLSNPQ